MHETASQELRREGRPVAGDKRVNVQVQALATGSIGWGDRFGRLPTVIERPVKVITDDVVATHTRRAKRMLHRRGGVVRSLDADVVGCYHVEPDDRVRINYDGRSRPTSSRRSSSTSRGSRPHASGAAASPSRIRGDHVPKMPAAQPAPRVPRSRRDDRFQKGHALCPKLGGIGVVTSRQGDTCTVLISDEELTGCIPLTTMPPVNAVVDVESRCSMVVILSWWDGRPPAATW